METVITRIMEIEKHSALEIELAENTCKKNIDALIRNLEEQKKTLQELIVKKENARLAQALQALKKKVDEESLAAGKAYETLLQDPAKIAAIEEKIVSILLSE
ncbi:MAG: hypothetical protein ABFD62_06010 [Syntrophaceae bacterium]|jgi:23S rRNA maturation-related 3'-5' exoribonuclease YhaM